MGGIASSLFGPGGGAIDSPGPLKLASKFPKALGQVTTGLDIRTPNSSLNADTGALTLDPTGRNMNLDAYNTFSQNIGQSRSALLGNNGAYINAVVRPLLERLSAGRGELQRNLGLTGVRGSYANQALQQYDINAARTEADARAQATQQTQTQLSALDEALFNAGTGVGTNIANQELAGLGLSASTIENLRSLASNLLTGAASISSTNQQAAAGLDAARSQNILGAVGAGLYGLGGSSLFGGAAGSAAGQTGFTGRTLGAYFA